MTLLDKVQAVLCNKSENLKIMTYNIHFNIILLYRVLIDILKFIKKSVLASVAKGCFASFKD